MTPHERQVLERVATTLREELDRNTRAGRTLPANDCSERLLEVQALLSDEAPAGEHDVGYRCLDGGWRGYQAVCWTCGWEGAEHVRGDEEPSTEEGREHKRAARREAAEHRRATQKGEADAN